MGVASVLGASEEKKFLKFSAILVTSLPLESRILKGMRLDYKKILQYLFPPSEDEKNIMHVLSKDFVDSVHIRNDDGVYSLLPYSDTRVRSAIHLLKFHNHARAKTLLSEALTTYLSKSILGEYIIIPIPLSKKRRRQRGYNQVTEIIKSALPALPTATLEENILIRKYDTTPQATLSRAERLHNLRGAFSIRSQHSALEKLTGKHLVLVDDVMTTGATLREAKSALKQICPKQITCIALAH